MNTRAKAIILAVTTMGLSATALLPANAQPPRGGPGIQHIEGGAAHTARPDGMPRFGQHMGGGMDRSGNLLGAFFIGGNAEAIDIAAVRLTHRLDLTETQQELLETLRVAAIDAADGLVQAREAIAPDSEADAATVDLVARYAGVVALTTARAEALQALQPAFDAFAQSLNADQLAQLAPPRQGRPDEPAGEVATTPQG